MGLQFPREMKLHRTGLWGRWVSWRWELGIESRSARQVRMDWGSRSEGVLKNSCQK